MFEGLKKIVREIEAEDRENPPETPEQIVRRYRKGDNLSAFEVLKIASILSKPPEIDPGDVSKYEQIERLRELNNTTLTINPGELYVVWGVKNSKITVLEGGALDAAFFENSVVKKEKDALVRVGHVDKKSKIMENSNESLKCPNCGAPRTEESNKCSYCGSLFKGL